MLRKFVKIHPLGYQDKPLEVRLQERLDALGWKLFKPDSKIQPNCCAKFIFGGNHDRTLEMAFGNQIVSLEKDADNSRLHRCEEIEHWAKDVYDWCIRRYGLENIVGFQVHLDESSPSYPCPDRFGRNPSQKRTRVCDVVGEVRERPV